ncbi:MAG: hypothetical protein QOE92_1019 [Chloroflexota bacterium]|nr:hypothetical protein [Chloroflexota bacterium]
MIVATPARIATVALLLLSGCGSSAAPAASASPQPAAPSGPPTAQVTAVGGAGLGGTIKILEVDCAEPRPEGQVIVLGGQTEGQGPDGVFLNFTLLSGSVTVQATQGSGQVYSQRLFQGTGVTGFDAARGAQVDSTFTETAVAGLLPGSIGGLTSLKATVDCAGQQPGSSTVTITGDTPEGAAGGSLSPVHVQCTSDKDGNQILVRGLTKFGSTPALVILTTHGAGVATIGANRRFYQGADGSAKVTATGAHFDGDLALQSGTAKLHVSGDATCGSSTKTA